jgi:hypothetical protein
MDIKLTTLVAACAAGWIALLSPVSPAQATDLNGSWATDASACGKVFIKNGSAVSFRPDSDQFGGGFIMEGNKVRGQLQTCTIKTRKEDGNVVHILAACATDIMASNIQFSARIIDDNTIRRIFPGMSDELSISYSRCPM